MQSCAACKDGMVGAGKSKCVNSGHGIIFVRARTIRLFLPLIFFAFDKVFCISDQEQRLSHLLILKVYTLMFSV
jgi:hypothetical protein